MLLNTLFRLIIPLQVFARTNSDVFYSSSEAAKRKDLIPGVATSYNLPMILEAMRCNNVERAQAAGWDCFRGVYVVYKNGAVVPGIPNDLPEISIYFKECEKGKAKIVFVYKECKRNIIYPCDKRPVPPCENRPIVHPQQPCDKKPEPECDKRPVPPCDKRPKCNRNFTKKCKKLRCGKNCKAKQLKSSTMSFVYAIDNVNGRPARVLIVNEKDKKETETKIILGRDSNLRIRILNHPEKLICIKGRAEKILGGRVDLYVTDLSKVYVLFKDRLYSVNNKETRPRLVNRKCMREIIRRGLYNVEFRS